LIKRSQKIELLLEYIVIVKLKPTNQPINQATKQPSNQATKQPSNQATKSTKEEKNKYISKMVQHDMKQELSLMILRVFHQ